MEDHFRQGESYHVYYHFQQGCCYDCGQMYSETELETHHIPKKADGGKDSSKDNVLLCERCHADRHLKENLAKFAADCRKHAGLPTDANELSKLNKRRLKNEN